MGKHSQTTIFRAVALRHIRNQDPAPAERIYSCGLSGSQAALRRRPLPEFENAQRRAHLSAPPGRASRAFPHPFSPFRGTQQHMGLRLPKVRSDIWSYSDNVATTDSRNDHGMIKSCLW